MQEAPSEAELSSSISETTTLDIDGVPIHRNFKEAIATTIAIFKDRAERINRGTWQGTYVADKPDMSTYEILYYTLKVIMGTYALEVYRSEIEPNLPWADDHFEERVSGNPLNPGLQWRKWPWGHSADKFRLDPLMVGDVHTREPVFDHTYMQRYWPRYAGYFAGGYLPPPEDMPNAIVTPRRGIYFEYGDLDGVVSELAEEPYTRQAILPVFFPEDTGYRLRRRKPCSLHYQWQLNGRKLDMVYAIRSCDIVRHFRDDIYLHVRLTLWLLNKLKDRKPEFWSTVRPGKFVMHIANLHCFANDWRSL